MTSGIPGPLLFGHYAFPPNRLGYCGPDDHEALFEYVVERKRMTASSSWSAALRAHSPICA